MLLNKQSENFFYKQTNDYRIAISYESSYISSNTG